MGTLGERFRRERELRGIPLSEIAAKTHIGARLLQAIEEEAYERLPGGIFNKSFIRQYAEYLGLDAGLAVHDYVRATAGREAQTDAAPEPRVSFAGDNSRAMTWVVVAAGVLAVVGLGGYLVHRRAAAQPTVSKVTTSSPPAASAPWQASSTPQSTANIEAQPALTVKRSAEPLSPPPELGPVNAEGEPVQQAAQSSSPQPSIGQPPVALRGASPAAQSAVLAAANTNAGELLLQINARSSVWISVTADGEKKWQGTLQANQSREIQATDSIRLTAGNAGGVSLILNGKDIGMMGGEGEVKTITLAAQALGEPVP